MTGWIPNVRPALQGVPRRLLIRTERLSREEHRSLNYLVIRKRRDQARTVRRVRDARVRKPQGVHATRRDTFAVLQQHHECIEQGSVLYLPQPVGSCPGSLGLLYPNAEGPACNQGACHVDEWLPIGQRVSRAL